MLSRSNDTYYTEKISTRCNLRVCEFVGFQCHQTCELLQCSVCLSASTCHDCDFNLNIIVKGRSLEAVGSHSAMGFVSRVGR